MIGRRHYVNAHERRRFILDPLWWAWHHVISNPGGGLGGLVPSTVNTTISGLLLTEDGQLRSFRFHALQMKLNAFLPFGGFPLVLLTMFFQ